jgi:hypothetical protein
MIIAIIFCQISKVLLAYTAEGGAFKCVFIRRDNCSLAIQLVDGI